MATRAKPWLGRIYFT